MGFYINLSSVIGKSRTRLPVALKIALARDVWAARAHWVVQTISDDGADRIKIAVDE